MAGKNQIEIDYLAPGGGKNKKRKAVNGKLLLISVACALVVSLAVIAAFFMTGAVSAARIVDFGTAAAGVKINGIDVSGMTREQVLEATAGIERELLSRAKFSLDVNGEIHEYNAQDFGIASDYQQIIDKAMEFGHTGAFGERERDLLKAKNEGVDFEVTLSADENAVKDALAAIKASLDKPVADATVEFTPWGHSADGTPFSPDLATIKAIVEAEARGKEYTGYPERVTIPESEMPSLYRYEYYKNDHFEAGYNAKKKEFVTGYRPPNANISRFYYTPESQGLSVDMSSVSGQIMSQIKSGKYETITVPCTIIEPSVKLADLKKNTQLISSWTSSFGKPSHYNYDRNWNVAMISSLINNGGTEQGGQSVILPGQQWSVNTIVGPRSASTAAKIGWKQAAGIENGGYTPQYGGGVCQLGSTTYNAARRTGLTVAKFTHHTIPSDYIPIGMDATLSTPAPDLVLQNDGTMPYYIVSYVNPTEKNVTVEIYGPSLTDPATGNDVIYTYTSAVTGRYGTPVSKVIECTVPTIAPDGTVIDGITCLEYQYAYDRQGTYARVWRLVYSLDGTQLDYSVFSDRETYPVINGTLYKWTGPLPSPSPTESPAETPTGSPTQ